MYKITDKVSLFLGKIYKRKVISSSLQKHPSYSSSFVDGIRIIGDEKFILQTSQAIDLLKYKDNDIYNGMKDYIDLIIFVGREKSSFVTSAKTYEVGIREAYEVSIEWYASSLAYWRTRSEIWHKLHINNPFYDRKKTEKIREMCTNRQKETLKKLGREDMVKYVK